jgi:hypothetical protein
MMRNLSGVQRLHIAFRMFSSARAMLTNHLRHEHPEWTDDELIRQVARRLSHGAI